MNYLATTFPLTINGQSKKQMSTVRHSSMTFLFDIFVLQCYVRSQVTNIFEPGLHLAL